MADVLVVYASLEGQTAKVARRIVETLVRRGDRVTAAPVEAGPSPAAYDAVVVGASIHAGRFPAAIVRYVREHLRALRDRPNALFVVCLTAARDDAAARETIAGYLGELREATGWIPEEEARFAGALRYRDYGLLKRALMRRIARAGGLDTDASRDHEYTDWGAVEAFASDFADRVAAGDEGSGRLRTALR